MKKILVILSTLMIFFIGLLSYSFAARKPLVSNFGTDTTGTDQTKLNLSEGNVVLDTVTQNWRIYYTRIDGSTTYFVYEPAIRVSVVVQGEVSFDTTNNSFIYKYSLSSLSNSTQKVAMLDMYNVTSSIKNVIFPMGWDKLFFEGDSDVFWYTNSEGLCPGSSTTGFQFESTYLPSVVSCWTKGVVPDYIFPDGEVEMAPDDEPNLDGDSVRGETIGPKVFPEPISSINTATTFINTIIWYTDECYTQGWMESTKARNKYKRLLQDCRTALTKHNYNIVKNKLQHLIDTAETDFAKQCILSEAYALIKYNAQYLKNQLSNIDWSVKKWD
ncbi:MAG: hypothetical protein ACE14V_14215 [bacterium]